MSDETQRLVPGRRLTLADVNKPVSVSIPTRNSIISFKSLQVLRLGLIARSLAVEAHSVPEPGIGTLKGDPVKIMLKENAQPHSVSTAHREPIPLMLKVKAELERMER